LCWPAEPGWNEGVIPGLIWQAELCPGTPPLPWHGSRITGQGWGLCAKSPGWASLLRFLSRFAV